jgi:hypothetical protein
MEFCQWVLDSNSNVSIGCPMQRGGFCGALPRTQRPAAPSENNRPVNSRICESGTAPPKTVVGIIACSQKYRPAVVQTGVANHR